MIKNLINKVTADLKNGENIENYLIIIVSLFILCLSTFGISNPNWVTNAILTILALLAYGRINDQQRLEQISKKMNGKEDSLFLEEYPSAMKQDLLATPELWIVGITLSRTVNTYYTLFEQKLKQGQKIKILMVSPESSARDLATFRDIRLRQAGEYDQILRGTLNDFCQLATNTKGDIEIRTINMLPSFGYFAMNPRTPQGKLYIEHYGFKTQKGDFPKLVLQKTNGLVYDSFEEQLFTLWENGNRWECF